MAARIVLMRSVVGKGAATGAGIDAAGAKDDKLAGAGTAGDGPPNAGTATIRAG